MTTHGTPIHYSDWASQPDIRIACDQSYTTPAWKTAENAHAQMDLPAEVYLADDGRLYTFTQKPTCLDCLRIYNDRESGGH
jgi:hypothetical protein